MRLLDESNLLFDFPGLEHDGFHDWRFFWTCNLSLPTRALREVGGFDAELFREAIVEDVELGYRLGQQGWRVLYREDAICHHAHELTPRSYFDRMVRLGVNLLRMWRKHGDREVIWMEGDDPEAHFKLLQLRYELYRSSTERLVERPSAAMHGCASSTRATAGGHFRRSSPGTSWAWCGASRSCPTPEAC